jgi:hypothetical protein
MMKDMGTLFAGALLGICIFAATTGQLRPPTEAELQTEYDSMQMCMKLASRVGCQMTIPDFVRYYELQELLGIPEPD